MSPFRELSNPHLSPAKQPSGQHPDIYAQGGRVDLSHYSEKEWPFLFREFATHLEQWSEKGQGDLFEQFLTLEVPSVEESFEVTQHLNDEQRAELATHLAFNVETLKYANLFHSLWDDLPETLKDKTPPDYLWERYRWASIRQMGEIIRGPLTTFITQHPERALLIAPFVDLTRIQVLKEDPPEALLPHERPHEQRQRLLRAIKQKPQFKKGNHSEKRLKDWLVEHRDDKLKISLLEAAFPDSNALIPLLDAYRGALSEEAPAFPRDIFNTTITAIAEKYPHVLVPYLVDFVQADALTPARAVEIFSQSCQKPNLNFFSTEEERDQRLRLEREFNHRYPKKQTHELDYTYEHPSFGLRMKAERLKEQALTRGVAMLCADPRAIDELIPPDVRVGFFTKCLSNDLPLFRYASEFKMTALEVQTVLTHLRAMGDMAIHLRDGSEIAALIQAGHETTIMQHLFLEFQPENIDTQKAVDGIERYIDLLSPIHRERWLELITKKGKVLWLDQLDAFLKLKPTSFRDFIESIAESDVEQLINHASSIFAAIQQLERSGHPLDLDAEGFKQILRHRMRENDFLFLEAPQWIRDFFPPAEVAQRFATIAAKNQDAWISKRLIQFAPHAPSEWGLRDQLHRRFQTEPELFAKMINACSDIWPEVKACFGLDQTRTLFLNGCRAFDFERFMADEMLLDLTDPKILQPLIQRLRRHHPEGFVSFLIKLADLSEGAKHPSLHPTSLRMLDEAAQQFRSRCDAEPCTIFQKNMIDVVGKPTAQRLVQRDLPTHLQTHPYALFDHKIARLIPDDQYRKLVHSRPLFYATHVTTYGQLALEHRRLPLETRQALEKKSTLATMLNTSLNKDYYDVLCETVVALPFGSTILKDLKRIARSEQKRHGQQLENSVVSVPEGVVDLVRRVDVLRSQPALCAREQDILTMPEQPREEILLLLEVCLLYQLIDNFTPARWAEDVHLLHEELKQRFFKFLRQVFDLPSLETLETLPVSQKMLRALLIYREGSAEKRPDVQSSFRRFVEKMFGGTFSPWRTWGVDATPTTPEEKMPALEHMKSERLLPTALRLDQYETWIQDEEMNFEETFDYSSEDLKYIIRKICRQAIDDGHLEEGKLPQDLHSAKQAYQEVYAPLKEWTDEIAELETEYRAHRAARNGPVAQEAQPFDAGKRRRFEELKALVREYQERNRDHIDATTAQLYLASLQELTMEQLEHQRLFIDKKQVPLQQVFKKLLAFYVEEAPGFVTDLERMQKELTETRTHVFHSEGQISKSRLRVCDKVDAETYFHIGAEPVPSCQHYNDGSMNEGLLAYVMDPNVRILQIHDADGKIMTRAILRLLETNDGKPALFLERIYSINNNPKIDEAVKKIALKKAKRMGVKIYTKEVSTAANAEDLSVNQLISRGSRHAYVYTDAGGTSRAKGEYTIDQAYPLVA